MAEFYVIWSQAAKAAADLSAKQYHFVRLSAKDTINQASHSAQAGNWGVLQTKPTADQHGTVGLLGVSKVVAGATITVNALITTDSSGRATSAASGDYVLGRALEAAAAGQTVTAEIFRPFYLAV